MNPNDKQQIDREIAELQADMSLMERIKSAPARMREALAKKQAIELAAETAEQTRARVEAELLERVHSHWRSR